VSTRDQAYERVLILRQKVQHLLKELEELQELRNRTVEAKSLVGLAIVPATAKLIARYVIRSGSIAARQSG